MKTWKKIVRLILLVVILLPVAVMIAIQIPAVQTLAVDKVAGVLTQNMDGTVHVGKVYFSYPNSLILKDVDLIQGADDTVAHLGKLLVKVKASSLLGDEARIRRVSLEDGRFNLRKYEDGSTNLSRLLAPMQDKAPKDTTRKGGGLPWDSISLDRLTLKHIDFSADTSLSVQDINLSARNFRYGPDGASGRIDNLTLRKGDELAVQQLSMDLQYSPSGSSSIRNLCYDDGYSNLHADYLTLAYDDMSDFSQFMDKVKLGASLRNTRFDMRTLHPFLPALKDMQLAAAIEGKISGTVSNLQSDHLRVTTGTGETVLDVKCRVKGLPDVYNTQFHAEIFNGETNTADLDAFVAGVAPHYKPSTISRYAPGETLHLTARADGPLSHLQSTANVQVSNLGHVDVEALVQIRKKEIEIAGNASTADLQLGRILGISSLGILDSRSNIAFASKGKNVSVDIQPLTIDHINFNGYDYSGLIATGTFQNGDIHAQLHSADPNVVLEGRSDISLGGKRKDSRYVVDLDVDHVDLNAIHLDGRDSAAITFKLSTDITQTPQGTFLGQARIQDLQASLPGQVFPMGDILLDSRQNDDRYSITLDSDLLRGIYDGNIFVTDFAGKATHLLYQDNLEHLFGGHHKKEEDTGHPEQYASFNLEILQLKPLTDFFLPSLFVAPHTSARGNLANDEITFDFSSELTAFDKLLLQNIQLRCLTMGERIFAYTDVDRLQYAGLMAEHIDIDATADSVIDLRLAFHNEDGSDTRANLHTRISFPDPETDPYPIRFDLLPSDLTIAGHPWEMAPASVRYRKEDIRIDDFSIYNGEQSLMAGGVVGPAVTDTVRLLMNDFDLGIANSFLTKPLNLQGLLTGRGEAFALTGPEKGILFDLNARYVSAVGIDMGHFLLQSHWDDPEKQFIFYVDNTMGDRHPVVANASLRPSDKYLRLDTRLDSLNVGIVEPLITGLASELGGTVSGHVRANGPLDKLSISSEDTRFNRFQFKLDFTQVSYLADGPFSVHEDGITFDNITIQDRFGHEGKLTGGVPYDHFKDIRLNLHIGLNNMMALNTGSKDNQSFYGRAFANGTVRVTGPLNKIRLNLNLTPTGNTTIHIPLGASASTGKSLLTFINNETQISMIDSVIQARNATEKHSGSGATDLSVNLRLNATPDAEIQLEVDKNTGDILKARGNGQIGITVAGDDFNIKGDYRVESGSYHFGMLGITARDFTIDPGGTIAFNGDVMQSDLDLTAKYRTKASLTPLIADSTAVGTRRTVDCGISVSGKLANPEIRFYVDIPDLDPVMKGRVETALNTEDKRMKQVLALLISGGFVPDEQSGIVNSTTLLFSNASEMMTSQLNNIFRQLDIPLDLGFNYQPNETGRDIFDVAVSTQLFNNRVIINGNIGNRQYMSSSQSDIVGDIDIEIKLNRQGQLRLTLFSHSADQYSNYLDQSQRNGAGIVYQEDFNSFKDLWRKIFHIKKNEESQALPDSNAPRRIRTE